MRTLTIFARSHANFRQPSSNIFEHRFARSTQFDFVRASLPLFSVRLDGTPLDALSVGFSHKDVRFTLTPHGDIGLHDAAGHHKFRVDGWPVLNSSRATELSLTRAPKWVPTPNRPMVDK